MSRDIHALQPLQKAHPSSALPATKTAADTTAAFVGSWYKDHGEGPGVQWAPKQPASTAPHALPCQNREAQRARGVPAWGGASHWPSGTRVGASISPATKNTQWESWFPKGDQTSVTAGNGFWQQLRLGKKKRLPKVSSDEQKHPEGWLGTPQQPHVPCSTDPGQHPGASSALRAPYCRRRTASPRPSPLAPPPVLRRCPHLHRAHGGCRPLRRHGAQLRRQRLHPTRTRQWGTRCGD